MNDARSSDPLDPLQGFTGLSLFHQRFKAIPDSSTSIPFDFDLNLQAIHYQFNSMASQVNLVDQVKNILSDTLKILKSGIPQAKQNNEVVPEKAEDNPLQRIPASCRELARFSVKPNSSQPNMCSLPPFDISWHENARKGKENLRGGAALDADQQAIHIRLNSMASQHSPSKLKDQVENIASVTSEIVEPGNRWALKQKNKVFPEKAAKSPRQRRPALGLKRAQFSMKPDSSQPDTNLLPPFDSKNYKDPEELFKEHEKYENAKKESEKLKGGAMFVAYKHSPSPIKRSRRPSIMRKWAKHKHSYPLMDFESSENGSPLNHSSQVEPNENVTWEEMDLAGSLAEEVNEGSFDELLSLNTECLEGDEAVTHVQKCLRMKSIEPEQSDLPEFQSMTNIDNLVKGLISSTGVEHRQRAEGSVHFASPTSPKSPFASVRDLHKRILHLSQSSDPFSAHDIDQLPVTNPSSVENCDKQSEQVDMGEWITISNELKSHLIEPSDKVEVAEIGPPDMDIEEFSHASKRSASEDSRNHDARIEFGSSGSHVDIEDNIGGSNMHNRVINDTSSCPNADTDAWDNGDNDGDEILVENEHEEAVAGAEPELYVADSTLGKASSTLNDNTHPDADTDNLDCGANDGDTVEDKHEEAVASEEPELNVADSTLEKTSSTQNENIQIKANSRPQRKRKSRELSRRKSLAGVYSYICDIFSGAGTTWQSGVRRSTRIKTRPLEYWKGERLLYGRIHNSLVTVIGIKYASPEKDNGRGPLKMKSFVSDEYKELVELAALH